MAVVNVSGLENDPAEALRTARQGMVVVMAAIGRTPCWTIWTGNRRCPVYELR